MNKDCIEYRKYISILKEELIPAMGCTEPIAVAYCAAVARETLGAVPEKVEIFASGNIMTLDMAEKKVDDLLTEYLQFEKAPNRQFLLSCGLGTLR